EGCYDLIELLTWVPAGESRDHVPCGLVVLEEQLCLILVGDRAGLVCLLPPTLERGQERPGGAREQLLEDDHLEAHYRPLPSLERGCMRESALGDTLRELLDLAFRW